MARLSSPGADVRETNNLNNLIRVKLSHFPPHQHANFYSDRPLEVVPARSLSAVAAEL